MTTKQSKRSGPGRPSSDGATGLKRINLAVTEEHHDRLKRMSRVGGASAWVRKAIDSAWEGGNGQVQKP